MMMWWSVGSWELFLSLLNNYYGQWGSAWPDPNDYRRHNVLLTFTSNFFPQIPKILDFRGFENWTVNTESLLLLIIHRSLCYSFYLYTFFTLYKRSQKPSTGTIQAAHLKNSKGKKKNVGLDFSSPYLFQFWPFTSTTKIKKLHSVHVCGLTWGLLSPRVLLALNLTIIVPSAPVEKKIHT